MNKLREFLRLRPMAWTADETFVMRFLFSLVLYFMAIHWELSPSYAAVPKPNGFAKIFPVGWMADPSLIGFLKPVKVSETLKKVVGSSTSTRAGITKGL